MAYAKIMQSVRRTKSVRLFFVVCANNSVSASSVIFKYFVSCVCTYL